MADTVSAMTTSTATFFRGKPTHLYHSVLMPCSSVRLANCNWLRIVIYQM